MSGYTPPPTRPMIVREGGGHGIARRARRLRCRMRSWHRTALYWFRGGYCTMTVSGHDYGEPRYENGFHHEPPAQMIPVEWEVLACVDCGFESRAWRSRPATTADFPTLMEPFLRKAADREWLLRRAADASPEDEG